MEFNQYDIVLNVLYTNLFTLSKEDKIIKLKNFIPKNHSHQVILKIANILATYSDRQIYIDISLFQKLKMRLHGIKTRFKCKPNLTATKTCNDIIEDIEKYYETGIFEKIYKEYYEVKK